MGDTGALSRGERAGHGRYRQVGTGSQQHVPLGRRDSGMPLSVRGRHLSLTARCPLM